MNFKPFLLKTIVSFAVFLVAAAYDASTNFVIGGYQSVDWSALGSGIIFGGVVYIIWSLIEKK